MRNHQPLRLLCLLLPVVLLVAAGPAAVAQDNCVPFKALTQATIVLDPNTMPPVFLTDPGVSGFAWGGQVLAASGDPGAQGAAAVEHFNGWFYGRDAATDAIYNKWNGRGKDGYYLFAFGSHEGNSWVTPDGFKLQLGQAAWTPNPAGLGLGSYQASGKLVDGYGRFQGASGTFTLHGDAIFYLTESFPGFVAAWNPMLEGKVCQ